MKTKIAEKMCGSYLKVCFSVHKNKNIDLIYILHCCLKCVCIKKKLNKSNLAKKTKSSALKYEKISKDKIPHEMIFIIKVAKFKQMTNAINKLLTF
jgi:hypothetical protein